MPYVASIGLYFVPVLCLLGAGWSYVRWKTRRTRRCPSVPAKTVSASSSPYRCDRRVPGAEAHVPDHITNKKQRKALLLFAAAEFQNSG